MNEILGKRILRDIFIGDEGTISQMMFKMINPVVSIFYPCQEQRKYKITSWESRF